MNFVIKTLTSQAFVERSKPLRTKFFSKADLRSGRQAMVNRAGELMNDADFDWNFDINVDAIRINLKKYLKWHPKNVGDFAG